MLTLPATPGVYLQRSDPGRDDIAVLRTDIVGFAGFAERGPIGTAVSLDTMRQFTAVYGNYLAGAELAYAVRAFFENGGRRCRAVRVASEAALVGAAPATLDIIDSSGSIGFALAASSPGAWGNGLEVSVRAMTRGDTLIPTPGAPERSSAIDIGLFLPGDLVRLSQPGSADTYRLVANVDREAGALVWTLPDLRARRPWEKLLTGFDSSRPIRVERIVHEIVVRERGRVVAIYSDLGLHPASRRFIGDVLRPVDFEAGGLEVVAPVEVVLPERPAGFVPAPIAGNAAAYQAMQGGRDGLAAVTVSDMIGRDLEDRHLLRGFFSLASARDLSILAAPDVVGRRNPPPEYGVPDPADPCVPCFTDEPVATRPRPPVLEQPPRFTLAEIARMQGALIDICELKTDRIALLDPPWETASGSPLGLAPIADWRRRFETSYGALAFPWCIVPDPMMRAATRAVPPCGHVAGRIAAEDNARGVPGTGANAPIDWITDTSIVIDRAAHGRLNEAGINALCVTHGRAPRLMGARMLSSVSVWRFITTRRIVCAIRRQLVAALQWAVFAPNDAVTRLMIVRQTSDYLEMLRRRGALAGAVPEEAYYARCDDTTTTQSDRDNGRLITEIGIAPSAPFEFIVLKLGKSADQFEIADQGAGLQPLFSEAAP